MTGEILMAPGLLLPPSLACDDTSDIASLSSAKSPQP